MPKAFQDKLYQLQDELWKEFHALVLVGAYLPATAIYFPVGANVAGLPVDSEGRSYFLATKLLANPNYTMHIGEDLIIGTEKVSFEDTQGTLHTLEPDITDLYWLAGLLDDVATNN